MYVRYLKKQYGGKIPSGTNKGDLLREVRIRCAAERGDKACAAYAAAQDKGKPGPDGTYPSVPIKYAIGRCVAVLQYLGPMGQDLDSYSADGNVTRPGEGEAAAACAGAAAPDPTTDGTHIPWERHHHAMDKFN